MKERLTILLSIICCAIPYQIFASDKNNPASNTSSNDGKGIFSHSDETNLISNYDFENLTSSWTLGKYNGGSGIFNTDSINSISGNQSAVVFTENHEQEINDVQLFTFFKVSETTLYSISFKASVPKACLISISVSNGIEIFYEEKLLLRPDEINYGPFTFKSEVDEPFSFFAFNLGKVNNTIHFDEVVIQADYTDKEFTKILAKTGINVHQNPEIGELFISLPTASSDDYPVIFMDESGKTVSTTRIKKGAQEFHFQLNSSLEEGLYLMKIFTPTKTLAYKFEIE